MLINFNSYNKYKPTSKLRSQQSCCFNCKLYIVLTINGALHPEDTSYQLRGGLSVLGCNPQMPLL